MGEVKYGDTNVVEVATDGCKNVYGFIKAVKKELTPLLNAYAAAQISISLTAGGDALDPGDAVPNQNTSRAPLYISIIAPTVARLESPWENYSRISATQFFKYSNPSMQRNRVLTTRNEMDVDIPNFDPTKFEVTFPFFESSITDYLKYFKEDALVGRDDQIRKVNDIISDRSFDKYRPIICSTSRGMGKTAFMEAIGIQTVKSELKNQLILDAMSTGRIISFDFASAEARTAVPEEKDIETFFTRLMIYFLCLMFHGCQVDGIRFEIIRQFSDVSIWIGRQEKFKNWLIESRRLKADHMMDEYIRLTNIAFGVECTAPPVFLLDEIQGLCYPTTVRSRFKENRDVYHTFLSLLITQLAGNHKPVCICTVTNNGKLLKITERSRFVPKFISLTTLHKEEDYHRFWAKSKVKMKM